MKLIALSQGYSTQVDDCDYDALSQFKWCAQVHRYKLKTTVYAFRNTPGSGRVYMHSHIMGVKGIDHRDRDGLNNQRSNLRIATQSQNSSNRPHANSSGYRGAVRTPQGRWRVEMTHMGKRINVGTFAEIYDAALAYNLKAEELLEEFAVFNTPIPIGVKP